MTRTFSAVNPAVGSSVWSGPAATAHEAAAAVASAHQAFAEWPETTFEYRIERLRAYAALCAERVEDVAQCISAETGKTLWESRGEAKLLGAKVKPSEKTPGTGELLVSLFHEAGFPKDVIQVVQGARETAEALIHCRETAGVLFTGSYAAGRAINQAMSSRPEVIVALAKGLEDLVRIGALGLASQESFGGNP